MRYVVHVIDESSQHEKSPEDSEYYLVKGRSVNGEECDIVRTDSWYFVDAEESPDAVVKVANTIRVEDSNGNKISLSDAFIKTQKDVATADVGDDNDSIVLSDTKREYVNQTRHDVMIGTCQIKKSNKIVLTGGKEGIGEEWYELHKVYFYVTKIDEIILVE